MVVLQKFLETGSYGPSRLEQRVEDAGLLEFIEGRHPGGHRHRIPGERAAVEEVPLGRIREVEYVRTTEERAGRYVSSDDHAQTDEVRDHAIRVLGPSERHANHAHPLVQN